jgi:hypothetical protein
MLKKFLGAAIAVGLLAVLVTPFAHEIYYRYDVWRHLDGVGDDSGRAAFREWNGDARGFEQQMRDRCVQLYGAGAAACERYRAVAD